MNIPTMAMSPVVAQSVAHYLRACLQAPLAWVREYAARALEDSWTR